MKRLLTLLLLVSSFDIYAQVDIKKEIKDLIPEGHHAESVVYGDLNNDRLQDCVILLKSMDQSKLMKLNDEEAIDLNRKGLMIVLHRSNNKYHTFLENLACFSSAQDTSSVYYEPELFIEIRRGNLYINYAHGRYGNWKYTFRMRDQDFQLIGFDKAFPSEYKSDYALFDEESVNFLTQKRVVRKVVGLSKNGRSIFKEYWTNISQNEPILLSEIRNIEDLNLVYQ